MSGRLARAGCADIVQSFHYDAGEVSILESHDLRREHGDVSRIIATIVLGSYDVSRTAPAACGGIHPRKGLGTLSHPQELSHGLGH